MTTTPQADETEVKRNEGRERDRERQIEPCSVFNTEKNVIYRRFRECWEKIQSRRRKQDAYQCDTTMSADNRKKTANVTEKIQRQHQQETE